MQTKVWETSFQVLSALPKPEFIGYKILHAYLFSKDTNDISHVLHSIPTELKENPVVDHAIQCVFAINEMNYLKFFRLYGTSPNYSSFLLDYAVDNIRLKALQVF